MAKRSLTVFDFEVGDGVSENPVDLVVRNGSDSDHALTFSFDGTAYEFSDDDARELYAALRVLNKESGRVVTKTREPKN